MKNKTAVELKMREDWGRRHGYRGHVLVSNADGMPQAAARLGVAASL